MITSKEKLNRLQSLIVDWTEGKQPLKKTMPPFLFGCCIYAYKELLKTGICLFVWKDMIPILNKCGIKTAIHNEIAFIATL